MDEIFMIQARHCKRCGRLLVSKEAVARGLGCQCAKRQAADAEDKKPFPGQISIFDLGNGENDDIS